MNQPKIQATDRDRARAKNDLRTAARKLAELFDAHGRTDEAAALRVAAAAAAEVFEKIKKSPFLQRGFRTD